MADHPPENISPMDQLFQQYISGELTDEDAKILLDRLDASPESRVALFEQLNTHVILEEALLGKNADKNVPGLAENTRKQIVSSSNPSTTRERGKYRPFFRVFATRKKRLFALASLFGVLLVGLLVAGVGSLFFLKQGPGRIRSVAVLKTIEHPEPISAAVAVLSATADAVWDERSGSFRQDQFVEPGWLRLRSGLVSLHFFNGAEVVIAGPAELEVLSVDHILCRFGNINVNIPPQAQGFLVSSPQMVVKDLGTSFAVAVSQRGTEVHVAKGEVELHEAGVELDNLLEGEALFMASQGTVRRFRANDDIFAPVRSLKGKTKEYQRVQYEKWKKRCNRFDDDPLLRIHFTFEDMRDETETVSNESLHAPGRDGLIVGCRKVEGRWSGKRAIEFSRASDRIRVSPFGNSESITLSAWVRVYALEQRPHILFVARDDDDKSRETPLFQWSVLPSGALRFEMDSPIPDEDFRYDSVPCFKPESFGQWTHVAVVVDGMTQTVTHFVNGVILGTPHVETPFKESLPLAVGATELGNVSPLFSKRSGTPVRHFCGCIDEFHFFVRPLSQEEIWDLYDPVPNWSADFSEEE